MYRTPHIGSIAVCDEFDIVVIPRGKQNEDFLRMQQFIQNQEDTWFDCIDWYKRDTFDTVCPKKNKDSE